MKEEIPGDDEEIVEGFDAFTQVDVKLSDRHSITGTLSVFPTDIENRGIDSLHPAPATPDTESRGWNVAIADELATGPNTLWRTQFAVRGFDVAVRPKGTGPAQLTPDGLRNNYFNEIDRQSRQLELKMARLQSWRWGTQEHLVKVGVQLLATSFDAVDRSGPIEVRGADGRLLRRITFRVSWTARTSSRRGMCRTTGRSVPASPSISVCGTTTTRCSVKAICRRGRRSR